MRNAAGRRKAEGGTGRAEAGKDGEHLPVNRELWARAGGLARISHPSFCLGAARAPLSWQTQSPDYEDRAATSPL
jgi:hypothetical protein